MIKPITLTEEEGKQKLSMPENLGSHISTFAYCYLQPNGWFNGYPANENEEYCPWYTYPAIEFLKDIIKPEHKVLEYGSGYSTLFYHKYVQSVTTVDHDAAWAQKIVDIKPEIDIYIAGENFASHPEAIDKINEFINTFPQVRTDDINHDLQHGLINNEFAGYASLVYQEPTGHYDIVAIDGMARALCAYLAVEKLSDDGIIILDNSDRWHYNNILRHLNNKGYGRIDFWGPGHNTYKAWCTSFFSKKFPLKNNNIERVQTEGFIAT